MARGESHFRAINMAEPLGGLLPAVLCLPLGVLAAALDRYAILLPWQAARLVQGEAEHLSAFLDQGGRELLAVLVAGCAACAALMGVASLVGLVRRPWALWLVRKGETFLYLSADDPWAEGRLHRLWLLRRRLWSLPKIAYRSPEGLDHPRFVFDGLWFGRYCFVVTDTGAARELLDSLLDYLRHRREPRAAARRTVHVVWDSANPLPEGTVRELAFLCKETNFKLLVASQGPLPSGPTSPFEEQIDLAVEAPP